MLAEIEKGILQMARLVQESTAPNFMTEAGRLQVGLKSQLTSKGPM